MFFDLTLFLDESSSPEYPAKGTFVNPRKF